MSVSDKLITNFLGSPEFKTETATAFRAFRGEEFWVPEAFPIYPYDFTESDSLFPIHCGCLPIIESVVSSTSRHKDEAITGLAAIQKFYQSVYSPDLQPHEIYHGWEHGYYGARRFARFSTDGWTMDRGWDFLCADPIEIPNLTDYLLSNLKTMPVQPQLESIGGSQQNSQSSKAALDSLPIEILDQITSNLACSTILRLHRTNRALSARISLGPSFWRAQLVSRNLIPFLWDLDAAKCREKERNAPTDTAWDWRLLTRTLKTEPFVEVALRRSLSGPLADHFGRSHVGFWRAFCKDAESRLTGSPPLGLVNRVRIVKIIEEAMSLVKEKN